MNWSKKYNECVDCKTTNRRHNAIGRCKPCYYKHIYKSRPERREAIKKSIYKWRDKKKQNETKTNIPNTNNAHNLNNFN